MSRGELKKFIIKKRYRLLKASCQLTEEFNNSNEQQVNQIMTHLFSQIAMVLLSQGVLEACTVPLTTITDGTLCALSNVLLVKSRPDSL